MKIITNEANASLAIVKLGDVKPNPYRRIDQYPILPSKVATLKNSMEDTGFWTNVIGRVIDGELQIAYGHHRLAAALEAFGPDHLHTFPVEDYDDEMMLRIMAEENSDEWANAVEHGMMVTKAARDYLDGWLTENADEAVKAVQTYSGKFGLSADPAEASDAGSNPLHSEVAIFIRLANTKSGAEEALLEAIERGVEQLHVALWLGKNYVTTSHGRPSASTAIRNGWNFIGMSEKRKAWAEKAEAERKAKEAEAAAKAAEARKAEEAARAEREAADRAAQQKAQAEIEAKRKANAARMAEQRAKDEAARKEAAEAKRKADEAAAKAKAEREEADRQAQRRARELEKAKEAERKAQAEAEAAKKREAALVQAQARLERDGLLDPEAVRLLPSVGLAQTFVELMVTENLGKFVAKADQVEVVSDFLETYPDGKADQLRTYLLNILRDSQARQSVLFALETDLKKRFDGMLSAQQSTKNAVGRFRDLIKDIQKSDDADKKRIMVQTLTARKADISDLVMFMRAEADRLEGLLK